MKRPDRIAVGHQIIVGCERIVQGPAIPEMRYRLAQYREMLLSLVTASTLAYLSKSRQSGMGYIVGITTGMGEDASNTEV